MRFSIFIFLLAMQPVVSYSQLNSQTDADWLFVATMSDKDSVFIASSYVKKYPDLITDNTIIKIWTKYKEKKTTINKKVYYNITEKILMEFDCTDKKIKTLRVVAYASNGKLINDHEFSFSEWSDVIPESMGEFLLGKVCLIWNE